MNQNLMYSRLAQLKLSTTAKKKMKALFPSLIFHLPLPKKNTLHLPNDLIYINMHIIGQREKRMRVYLTERGVTAADTLARAVRLQESSF